MVVGMVGIGAGVRGRWTVTVAFTTLSPGVIFATRQRTRVAIVMERTGLLQLLGAIAMIHATVGFLVALVGSVVVGILGAVRLGLDEWIAGVSVLGIHAGNDVGVWFSSKGLASIGKSLRKSFWPHVKKFLAGRGKVSGLAGILFEPFHLRNRL